jgi:hypothetical protein
VGDSRGDVLEEHADLLTPIDDESGLVLPVQLLPKYPQASQRLQPYSPIHDFPHSLILNHLQLLPNSLLPLFPFRICPGLLPRLGHGRGEEGELILFESEVGRCCLNSIGDGDVAERVRW